MAGKVESYLGFCLRSREIALGTGSVEVQKKGVFLIIVCSSASENLFKLAIKFKNRFSCPLMICNSGLEKAVHREGCKIAAVKNKELAGAICANADQDYVIYTER